MFFALAVAFPFSAQTKKQTTRKKAKTTRVAKKRTATKKKKTAKYQSSSIKGLRNQRAGVQRKIKQQERLLRANKADVKKRLGNLLLLNSEIDRRKKSIDTIQNEITHLDGNISMLQNQLSALEKQLSERKAKYVKSMRYLAARRTVQDKLMFIFSAKNFTQMYRRLRFVREYAAYQRTQGEMVKAKQRQIEAKHKELARVRGQKNALLDKGRREHTALESKQAEQQKMVKTLQRQQKTIEGILAQQRKKNAELNARIDRLVAEEVAKAKARAEAEARRKAEAAAAAKRKAEELARKKAAAEAAARENARRIAEAKAKEERLKAEAREAAKKDAAAREAAERRAKEAEADRIAAERKARVDKERAEREVAKAKKKAAAAAELDTQDRKLSGTFERNRGRLPMPIAGPYKIVTHFGRYNVPGLRNVTLESNGLDIQGQPGAAVRSVFDGEVSGVSNDNSGSMMVIVRHGSYLTAYCNLGSISVRKGQKVSTGQKLGTVGPDNRFHFQLRNWMTLLNPERWLAR